MDDDAPASDAVLALDAPERVARGESPPPVADAVGNPWGGPGFSGHWTTRS
jgi:hypothetical protein